MKFRKFKTLYIIDHPIRDLPAYSWWCSIQANDYFENYMVSTSDISMDFIKEIKPDAIVWNCARPQNSFLIRFAFLKGIKNIVHDTEGILYKDNEYLNSLDKLTFQCIHSIWCWGNEQKRIINKISLKNCKRELAINIGSIRYEYYKNKGLKNKNKNKILVNTNFPVIAPRYASLKSEFNTWVNIEKKLNKFQFIQKCIDLSAMRESILNFIKNLIEKQEFPPELITLRIHPFESIKYYESIRNLGVNISDNKDISDDISEAIIIAQCGCQTVLDGLIQKVPSILIEPNYENIWSNISSKVDIASLKKIINDKNEYKNFKENFINDSFNKIGPYISNIKENINLKLLFESLKEKKSFQIHNFLIIEIVVLITKSFLSFKKFLRKIIYKESKNKAKLTNLKIEKYLKNNNIKFKKYKSKYICF